MSVLTAFLLGAGMSITPPPVPAEQPTALSEIVKRLRGGAPSAPLIEAGVKFVTTATATQLTDELALLSAVADRRVPEPQRRKEFKVVAAVLERKYKDDPDALLRVLLAEADLYRDCLSDRKTEGEVLEKAEILQEGLQARQAVSRLTVFLKLGETYLGVVDPKSGTQKKSAEYYAKVIAFEFPGRPTGPHYGDYQAVYINAASRLVEITKGTELKHLRFEPFALEALGRLHPTRAKLLNPESPGVAAFNAKVERWLELMAADLPKDSALHFHFQSLLQHVRKDKP